VLFRISFKSFLCVKCLCPSTKRCFFSEFTRIKYFLSLFLVLLLFSVWLSSSVFPNSNDWSKSLLAFEFSRFIFKLFSFQACMVSIYWTTSKMCHSIKILGLPVWSRYFHSHFIPGLRSLTSFSSAFFFSASLHLFKSCDIDAPPVLQYMNSLANLLSVRLYREIVWRSQNLFFNVKSLAESCFWAKRACHNFI
jgi:hypothetical protein